MWVLLFLGGGCFVLMLFLILWLRARSEKSWEPRLSASEIMAMFPDVVQDPRDLQWFVKQPRDEAIEVLRMESGI